MAVPERARVLTGLIETVEGGLRDVLEYLRVAGPRSSRTRIAYEDTITWRHNIGPGGTATVSLAGQFYYYW
jgi:hypothetical protein